MRFEFRAVTQPDLSMLFEWHQRPHLLEWWDHYTSIEKLRADIFDWDVHPFLAYVDDKPVGYIQWYLTEKPGVVGIDQFLADPSHLNRGFGTALITQFVESLFADPEIKAVIVDPVPDNARAIRCYEKAGFRSIGIRDGAHFMRIDRSGRR